MKVDERTLKNVHALGEGENPPRIGFTPSTLPEAQCNILAASSKAGVSTRSMYCEEQECAQKEKSTAHWYVLRCTYARERIAYEYMTNRGVTTYYPTRKSVKIINGKRKVITESHIPNIFFAYGTIEQLKVFVYDNVNLPFLRFYYRHSHINGRIEKSPLVVPNHQIESLKIVCASGQDDIIISPGEVQKIKKGQLVRVVKGEFEGVIGRVARCKGQQRVGIVVGGLMTVMTAYVPSAYCEKFEEKNHKIFI